MLAENLPRLLFLNRCYWPDTEATGQLLTELCENLADEFEVHVVCGQPNSPSTSDFVASGIETRNRVTIHRLSHTRFAKRVPAGRILNLVSFTRATANYLRRKNLAFDAVITETDPFLLPLVSAKHAKRIGSKLVCYLQDIYPDVAEETEKVRSGWLTRKIRDRLREAYLMADRIVVLGNCMRDRLASPPWSLDATRLAVIPNWADCHDIQPQPVRTNTLRKREGLSDKFVVMHSGNMGLTQRLDVLVEATTSSDWPADAVLMLIGDGAARSELQRQAAGCGSRRVRFLPYQPRSGLATSLSAADLHVISMHERITGCLCPSKLYGILAAGRPVLAIANQGTDLVRTVRERELGWYCPPGDAEAIAQVVADAASNAEKRITAGQNARQLACERFDRPVVIEQFRNLIVDVLHNGSEFRQSWNCDNLQSQPVNG